MIFSLFPHMNIRFYSDRRTCVFFKTPMSLMAAFDAKANLVASYLLVIAVLRRKSKREAKPKRIYG